MCRIRCWGSARRRERGPSGASFFDHVCRHRIEICFENGGVRIRIRRRNDAATDGILMDVTGADVKLLAGHDLAFIESSHPDVALALEAEGKAAFDVLHCFFQRNIRGGRDEGVEMIGQDDVCVELESTLVTVVEDRFLEQFGVGGDLEEAAALRGDGGDKIRACFLRRQAHVGRIIERPAAKAA